MDITVDAGFNVDFISKDTTQTQNSLTGCSVCAEDHGTEKCSIFDNLIHIKDTKVLPRALFTLPSNLKVETLTDGSKTVIATQCFSRGIQFGPYQAGKFYSLNPFDNFPIKIFGDSENILPDCYLDSKNEEKCNWMCYVEPAQNFEEQNLICYQIKLDIFFSVIRDIQPGEHLKVWYSTYYAAKIGSKIYTPQEKEYLDESEKIQQIAEKLPAKTLGAEERQIWCCKMCGQNETNVVKFAKHLQKHYIKMLKNLYVCNICNAGFSTEKALKSHRKYVHTVQTDIKPQDIEPSKTDLIEATVSLPIENYMPVTLTESDQLLMLDQLNYNDLNDAETLRAILCDDNTKASKTAQEKSIADFSLEFVESEIPKLQAPYFCDICNKLFTNLQYLFRHLKKHTGEYTCVQCLLVFTRRENYLRHACFTANNVKRYNCSYCSKFYYQKKYLRRHISRHLEKFPCNNCNKHFKSKYEQQHHSCILRPPTKYYKCQDCDKKFILEVYLLRHVKRCHVDPKIKEKNQKLICEICAKIYHTAQALRTHKKQHAEPKYECRICSKKFYRLDLYNIHLEGHGTEENEVCDVCNKKFKTKRNLKEHKVSHETTRITCDVCGKKFTRKTGLRIHQNKVHLDNPIDCKDCGKILKNQYQLKDHKKNVHSVCLYTCTICNKSFSCCSFLNRHIKVYHSGSHSCNYCSKNFKIIYSLKQHLQKVHSEFKHEWNKTAEVNNASKTEVLLKIPEANQNLEKSVYILENGTVETTESMKEKANQNLEKSVYILESGTVETTESIKEKNLVLNISNNVQNFSENTELLNVQETPIQENCQGPETLLPVAENEQQITLGKNAYILEDGTIVQPEEQGNLMIYILNQQLNN